MAQEGKVCQCSRTDRGEGDFKERNDFSETHKIFTMTSNMGDWEALAEIHLDGQQGHFKDRLSTYCLCSRVFIK